MLLLDFVPGWDGLLLGFLGARIGEESQGSASCIFYGKWKPKILTFHWDFINLHHLKYVALLFHALKFSWLGPNFMYK